LAGVFVDQLCAADNHNADKDTRKANPIGKAKLFVTNQN
jgi:hypothetical protein